MEEPSCFRLLPDEQTAEKLRRYVCRELEEFRHGALEHALPHTCTATAHPHTHTSTAPVMCLKQASRRCCAA